MFFIKKVGNCTSKLYTRTTANNYLNGETSRYNAQFRKRIEEKLKFKAETFPDRWFIGNLIPEENLCDRMCLTYDMI